MSIKKSGLTLLSNLAVSLTLCMSPVAAGSAPQPDGQPRALVRSIDVARPGATFPDAVACVRACDKDETPCDPVAFKRADGRCTGD